MRESQFGVDVSSQIFNVIGSRVYVQSWDRVGFVFIFHLLRYFFRVEIPLLSQLTNVTSLQNWGESALSSANMSSRTPGVLGVSCR